MTIKVCIAGATGWVGRELSLAVARADDLTLVGAISRTHRGKSLRDALGEAWPETPVSGTVDEALGVPADVLVDYTHPTTVKANALAAVRRGVNVVVGTSGLADEDFAEIHRAAAGQGVGVIAAGNFAISAVLLQRFARDAAKYLSHWEIVDYASAGKVDSPSGTARELAARLAEIRTPELKVPIENTIGPKETRGATLNGSQVHSIRLPGYTLSVEVVFGADDERLSIRHDAGGGAAPYLQGTLLAIRKVKGRVGLVRGLEQVMD